MDDDWIPTRFIDDEVEVEFERPPVLLKDPHAPDAIRWRNQRLKIEAVLSRWFDFGRKGRKAKNMKPGHLEMARQRGSWGVGRFFFRVQVSDGRVFDLYYDRAPKDADDRLGRWVLWRELEPGDTLG